MDPFALYDSLEEDFKKDKVFLNSILNIKTDFKNTSELDIDNLYSLCDSELYDFSIKTYCSTAGIGTNLIYFPKGNNNITFALENTNESDDYKPYTYYPHTRAMDLAVQQYKMNLNNSEITEQLKDKSINTFAMLEMSIKNHCIIKSLYTFEYLSVINQNITSSNLLRNYYKDYNMNKDDIPQTITSTDRNNFYKLFNSLYDKTYQKQLVTLHKYKDLSNNYVRKASTFMSFFTYKLLRNQGRDSNTYFNLDSSIKSIINNKNNKYVLKEHVNNFICGINKLYNLFSYNGENLCESVLFNYKKELSFNHDIIWYYYQKNSPQNKTHFYCLENNTNTKPDSNILELILELPNAFTRSSILNFITSLDYTEQVDMVIYLKEIIFPLYEKTFFISLYGKRSIKECLI